MYKYPSLKISNLRMKFSDLGMAQSREFRFTEPR